MDLENQFLKEPINTEVDHFLKILKKNSNMPFEMDFAVNVAVNVIWGLVAVIVNLLVSNKLCFRH